MTDIPNSYFQLAKTCIACKSLVNAFKRGKGSHAYIMQSADTLLSRCIALSVICEAEDAELPNSARSRRIISGKCMDVKTYGEEGINVAAADEIVSSCLMSPLELDNKYYILLMDESNAAVENKLLKTLEEAPRSVVFFLIVTAASSLLPTVRSRCEIVSPFLNSGEIERHLVPDEQVRFALYGGRESLTEYDSLVRNESSDQLMCAIEMLQAVGGSANILSVASLLPTARRSAARVIGYLELVLGDIMRANATRVETYGLYDMKKMKEKFPASSLPSALEAVRDASKRVSSGNMASVADSLAIKLSEVLYNAKSSRR